VIESLNVQESMKEELNFKQNATKIEQEFMTSKYAPKK
jgi:hypothetical protein